MRDLAEEFVRERDKEANVAPLKGKLATVLGAITKSQSDRTALVGKSGGDQERLKAYAVVAEALQTRRSEHEQLERRRAALENLARQVTLDRSQGFPEALRQMKARHQAAQLPDAAWSDFLTNYVGDVDKTIAAQKDIVTAALGTLAGSPLAPLDPGAAPSPLTLLPADSRTCFRVFGRAVQRRGHRLPDRPKRHHVAGREVPSL